MERTRGLGTTPKTFIVLLEKLIESCYSYVTDILFLPKVKASALMALGLCCTFLGYEYSRVASIILLSSDVSTIPN